VSVLRSPSGRSDHRGSRRGLPASQSGWPVYRGSPVGLPASRSRRAAVPTAVRCPSPPRSRDGLLPGSRRARRRDTEVLDVGPPRCSGGSPTCSSSKRRGAPRPNTAMLFVEAPKRSASEHRRARRRGTEVSRVRAPSCFPARGTGVSRGVAPRCSPWSTVAFRGVAPRCFAVVHRGAPRRRTEVLRLGPPWCSVLPIPFGVRSGPPRRCADLQRVAASFPVPDEMGGVARGDRA
jgi:hypothetical protein